MNQSINDVLNFWFSDENAKKWFRSSDAFDAEISHRFESLWQSALKGQLDSWAETADGCLALCLVLDQFALNMYRGDRKSFQTEQQAVDVATKAIAQGFDDQLEDSRVSFLYMPLMHSEDIDDQNLSVQCFNKRNLQSNLRFAKHHRAIIVEFGRFPHRNALLGRESTADELAYLQSKRAFKG